MTSIERAEKVVTEFNGDGACLSNTDETVLEQLIAAELDAVEKEARADAILKMGQWEHASHVQHNCPGCRNKWLEEAAKICDEKQKEFDGTHSICDILATEIRSLAKNTETK